MIRMPRLPSSTGAPTYFAAWLVPWRPIFRVRSARFDLSLFVHRKDVIGRHVAKYGEYEPVLTQSIDERLQVASRGLFIDVGANVGWHTLHAARHPSIEAVIASSPDLFNAYLVDCNIRENGIDNVVISTCAVGSQPCTVCLYRYKSSNLGRHSLLKNYGMGSRGSAATRSRLRSQRSGLRRSSGEYSQDRRGRL
jgi:FkbM family methyltransferase